jgi:SAM-dependent methyltransferase
MQLPPAEDFQYFSHLTNTNQQIPKDQWTPMSGWDYHEFERRRYEFMFLTDPNYIQGQRCADLGCHSGFMSYMALKLGAASVHGVNARKDPIDMADFIFRELGMANYAFECSDLEKLDNLKSVCDQVDTVILTGVLEHLRNPYAILDTISRSSARRLIFESGITGDLGVPTLEYRQENTASVFATHDGDRSLALCARPNLPWITMTLWHMGWHVEHLKLLDRFDAGWFEMQNTPGATPVPFPRVTRHVFLLATKLN